MVMELVSEELQAPAELQIGAERKTIKLIVSDIEGCLNLDERTYDYDALSWIRSANQLARSDNTIPFITVASGRQHAFVEAIVRMIDGRMPAIFENGCGLFFPTRNLYDEYEWHPSITEPKVAREYAKVKDVVERVDRLSGARRVIGKEVLITLHPRAPMTVDQLRLLVEQGLDESGVLATVTSSASAVDIGPLGIDKGAGLRWLISMLDTRDDDVELSDICGIGDSRGDISLLSIVGLSAAPANASAEVQSVVTYSSPWPDGRGVVSVIERCIAINSENR